VHPTSGAFRIIGHLTPAGWTSMRKRTLQILFGFILVSLTAYNIWASTQQPLLEWRGLTARPDNAWTIATFIDAYYGFITFYVWVLWKETRTLPRVSWFIAIMALGNIAMSAYLLRQLARLDESDSMNSLLSTRNA
jgi:type IV secretory pathway TraG/TraD family ATPase VirD4